MALVPQFLLLEDGRMLLQEDGNRGIILYYIEVADTPTERVYPVGAEDRSLTPTDDRGLTIGAQDRGLMITDQDRSLEIGTDDRTLEIKRE